MSELSTARLTGVPVTPEAAPALAALLTDPRVARTLGGVPSPRELAETVARQVAHWAAHGVGDWLWSDRGTGAVVARGGLQLVVVGGRPELEVGWAVDARRWGEGLGSELGAAAVEHAFAVVGVETLVAFTLPHNFASRRVMEKLGFARERRVVHAGRDHVLYRLHAPRGDRPAGELA